MVFQSYALYPHLTVEFVARFIGSVPMHFLPVETTGRPSLRQLVDTAFCFALPATTWSFLERGPHSARRYTLRLRPENILLQLSPDEHLLPATLTLFAPLGRKVLLSAICDPHLLKVLVPAPCGFTPDTPVWLNLGQGP
jgi:ABC-type sugar transport system ATPase subunit